MFSHKQIWTAIDRLARYNNLSASGLARRAGLDPTTFNKSKRFAKDGRARWPSTESLAKVLSVTNTDFDTFNRFVTMRPNDELSSVDLPRESSSIPMLEFSEAASNDVFDSDGDPTGDNWQALDLGALKDPSLYALKINGGEMEPVYRDGDVLLVSTTAEPRSGDRVILRTNDGEITARTLVIANGEDISLVALNPEAANTEIPRSEITWISRIVWASQ
ncbi:MAG: helix-turn-helix transcriptional regulator [Pseudomonadota bacterium]